MDISSNVISMLNDITRQSDDHRKFVPYMVEYLGVKSMAEIGVRIGLLTMAVLGRCSEVHTYYCVDPWEPYPDELTRRKKWRKGDVGKWDERYEKAKGRIERIEGNRAIILRMTSLQAAEKVEPESLDLVFIDALHTLEHVNQDIRLWLPAVRKGGYLAGHDFDNSRFPGVRKAVEANFGKEYHHWGDVWAIRK